jgi:hypothetical protein
MDGMMGKLPNHFAKRQWRNVPCMTEASMNRLVMRYERRFKVSLSAWQQVKTA